MPDHFQFAQKAFIAFEGALLLVRKSDADPENPGRWEVPGGRMAFGEDVDDHIRREIREEVGLDIVPGRPLHIWQWVMPDHRDPATRIQVVAVARVCETRSARLSTANRVDDDFLDQCLWVPFAELSQYDLIPSLRPAMSRFKDELGPGTVDM
jgi:8-oxo-dGTP pyrophosphatase MutT (NUDIX family)